MKKILIILIVMTSLYSCSASSTYKVRIPANKGFKGPFW